MINIQIDEEEVKSMYLSKLEEKMKEVEAEVVFWDRNTLIRVTNLSWNTITDHFFHDPKFPKYKVGKKWLFPAQEAKQFLLDWLKNQPSH